MKLAFRTFSLSAVLLLLLAAIAWTQEASPPLEEQDVVYGKADGIELRLDIAYPTHTRGPYPALVYIYCAWGWYTGFDREFYGNTIRKAAQKGYVAVTIDFRRLDVMQDGCSRYPFPAQVEDAKAAVRWLRANSARYNTDPNRIGALGWSGGGHMALMLGLTDPTDGFEGSSGNEGFSSKVQAVVSAAGIVDMAMYYEQSLKTYRSYIPMIQNMMQGTPDERPKEYESASPITYVRADSPPILTLHGDKDRNVWLQQAEELDAKMKEAGAYHKLVVDPGATHLDFLLFRSHEQTIFDFLDSNLKTTEQS